MSSVAIVSLGVQPEICTAPRDAYVEHSVFLSVSTTAKDSDDLEATPSRIDIEASSCFSTACQTNTSAVTKPINLRLLSAERTRHEEEATG